MLLIQYLIMNNNRVLMREVLYVFMKTTLNLNKYRWHWLQLEKVLVPACAPCYLAWYFGICTFIVKYFIRQICRHLHFFGPGGLFLWVLIVWSFYILGKLPSLKPIIRQHWLNSEQRLFWKLEIPAVSRILIKTSYLREWSSSLILDLVIV